MLGKTRKVFASKDAFDYHPTTKHKEQDPLPDQLKGMWFCICHKLFRHSPGRKATQLPISGDERKPVSQTHIGVIKKGEKKVVERFGEKLHACFPEFRLLTLQKSQESVIQGH